MPCSDGAPSMLRLLFVQRGHAHGLPVRLWRVRQATAALAPIRAAGSVVCASVSITAEREGGTDLLGCLAV